MSKDRTTKVLLSIALATSLYGATISLKPDAQADAPTTPPSLCSDYSGHVYVQSGKDFIECQDREPFTYICNVNSNIVLATDLPLTGVAGCDFVRQQR